MLNEWAIFFEDGQWVVRVKNAAGHQLSKTVGVWSTFEEAIANVQRKTGGPVAIRLMTLDGP